MLTKLDALIPSSVTTLCFPLSTCICLDSKRSSTTSLTFLAGVIAATCGTERRKHPGSPVKPHVGQQPGGGGGGRARGGGGGGGGGTTPCASVTWCEGLLSAPEAPKKARLTILVRALRFLPNLSHSSLLGK